MFTICRLEQHCSHKTLRTHLSSQDMNKLNKTNEVVIEDEDDPDMPPLVGRCDSDSEDDESDGESFYDEESDDEEDDGKEELSIVSINIEDEDDPDMPPLVGRCDSDSEDEDSDN